MKKIGLLHPGAMGQAVGQTLVNAGHHVFWVSNGRSAETRQRAEGFTAVPTLSDLVEQVNIIVCVCPPHAAVEVAEAVIGAGFAGVYLDANAISPQKSRRIGEKMTAAAIDYVDGGIVGLPPTQRGTSWLHLSGSRAAEIAALFAAGPLEVNVLDEQIGRASAVKMCFAANTKGTTALLSAILGAAAEMGVQEALEEQWAQYDPEFPAKTRERVARNAHQKAWRFVGEMEEMVETFGSAGIPNGFFRAAADIYRRTAHFKNAPDQPDAAEVINALKNNQ